ncbi:MAG: type IV secretory system conjugative DNA transfer family protein [Pseudomonadota bacterium]
MNQLVASQPIASAQYADTKSVAETYRYWPGHFWLGRLTSQSGTPIGYDDDRHICLVAGTRGGKGASYIIPNLCLWPGSVVVLDPKGENAEVTAARRGPGSEHCEGMGQTVHVLDPYKEARIDGALRSRYNPLDLLDANDQNCVRNAERIAVAFVPLSTAEEKFWENGARRLIAAIILYVATAPEFTDRRNLVTVAELITRGDVEAAKLLREQGMSDIPSGHALLFAGMKTHDDPFNDYIVGRGERFENQMNNAPKQWEGVLDEAVNAVGFINTDGMRSCLSTSDFKLSDLKTDPKGVSLYLTVPQRFMSEDFRWLRMMIALITTEMEVTRGQPATGHRILMCLDEFAGLRRMDTIENAVAQMAGYGLKLFFVLQDLNQLKAIYKERWETFISNAGLKVFTSVEDNFTREYASKQIGEAEVIRRVRSRGQSETEGESESYTDTETWQRSEGRSRSRARSRSKNRNWGRNSSVSDGRGTSEGEGWRPSLFGLLRSDRTRNRGTNRNRTNTRGQSEGWGETIGITDTEGTNYSQSRGGSRGHTRGTTRSQTRNVGEAETVHRVPLIAPAEVGRYYARIDDKKDPSYPGKALVIIGGEDAIEVRRTYYYDDPAFARLYDPHPDYPDARGRAQTVTIAAPGPDLIKYISPSANFIFLDWHTEVDGVLRRGQPYLSIINVTDDMANLDTLSSDRVTLRSPVNGVVSQIGSHFDRFYRSPSQFKRETPFTDMAVQVKTSDPEPYSERVECQNLKALAERCLEMRNARRGFYWLSFFKVVGGLILALFILSVSSDLDVLPGGAIVALGVAYFAFRSTRRGGGLLWVIIATIFRKRCPVRSAHDVC